MKKITITLSDRSEEYFNEVAYSLDYGDGKVATQSQIINHCLEELAEFERVLAQDVTGYLRDNYPLAYGHEKLQDLTVKDEDKSVSYQ